MGVLAVHDLSNQKDFAIDAWFMLGHISKYEITRKNR